MINLLLHIVGGLEEPAWIRESINLKAQVIMFLFHHS